MFPVKKPLSIFFFFCLPLLAIGQVTIQGSIKDEEGVAVGDAIIMIVNNSGESVSDFTNSDDQGRYRLLLNSEDDSLYVRVSRLDYATQLVSVANRSQQLDFKLIQQVIELKEVTVRPRGVWRNRDTVNYPVSAYSEQSDRTISDILRKMPGIEIQPSGAIHYNNEPINKFYVEGLDLMGGRYSAISENLKYESVKTVQILENHEPIKAMEDVSLSDRAALNIVLTDDARAVWQSSAKLGLGFTPLLWDNELTLMRFAKNNQDLIVYKTNNIGNASSRELRAHYGNVGMVSSNQLLSIPLPNSGISDNRSLFNNQHMITANRLIKLDDVYQLRLNADYLNDRHERNSSTHMVHFLDGTEIITDEKTHSVLNINRTNLTATLTGNHPEYFLENILNIKGDWSSTLAGVSGTNQRLKSPDFSISDDFRWLKVMDRKRIDVQSYNKLSSMEQSLTIKPGLFADYFNDSIPYENLKQDADLLQFTSSSSVSFSISKGHWQTNYDLGVDMDIQKLNSKLSLSERATADTLRNEFSVMLIQPFIAARYNYITKKLTATLNLPISYTIQQSNDQLNNVSNNKSRPYFNPSLNLRYKIGYQWELSSSVRYSNNFSTIRNLYTGYLLSDYRTISKNSGEFSGSSSQSYNLRLSYNEPLKSINASVSASYGRSQFDMLPEVDFDGILSISKLVEYKGYNDSKNLSFNLSKGISSFITKANLYTNYFISSGHQQQQGVVVASKTEGYGINFNLDGKISSFVNYVYGISYNSNKTDIKGITTTKLGTISRTSQNFRLNVFPVKSVVLSTIMNYNQSITGNNLPSTFFMDLRVRYKIKKWEFNANCNNILNANRYVIADYSNFFSSVDTFELRPANVVFSVRFSL
ncbi:MAG: TonB-dependent receptor [Culturomica sp.]|jgi:hypothetical protein|nr:TonB-dependent receptor [Culturomica sp.]